MFRKKVNHIKLEQAMKQIDMLIEHVRSQTTLNDPGDCNYVIRDMKNDAWTSIAQTLAHLSAEAENGKICTFKRLKKPVLILRLP
jgi:Alcohol dehydrogenase transcription factor Myb/SANT-like